MSSQPSDTTQPRAGVALRTIAREWGRIGCIGFGGPPAHITLFRELCVTRREWLTEGQFERAIAATNLLPGPASTQLAIYCAWRLRGPRGAAVGGLGFILPGLVAILALSAVFLAGSPPTWIRGAGMGAGAAVAAVAIRAGLGVAAPIWRRTPGQQRPRILGYALAGGVAAATSGPWLVLVLLACGTIELTWQRRLAGGSAGLHAWPLLAAVVEPGGTGALVWTALKVGALAFGGGFVIVPLMQSSAVNTYHWMTQSQFLNAVALGQVTPGPVTQTVAAVGYSAGGLPAGLLAAGVAFAPSFAFVLFGAARFERPVRNERVTAFLAGAAPAAAGAIIGSAVPLAGALSQTWQYALLAAAAIALLALRGSVVATLLAAGAVGATAGLLGAPLSV
ncbi:MAG TPA: chromate efflux transporter [Solirubrobacteraceae bacterium]|nr:chromate efflux transporter [Solirubrobacteraceae bacterium]